MMKSLFIYLLCPIICLGLSNYLISQNISDNFNINYTNYNYILNDKRITVCEITIKNSSKNEYIFWFDDNDIRNYDDDHKIYSYFFKQKGDFNLFELIKENLLINKPPHLYKSFLKNIKREEMFTIRIIGENITAEMCKVFIDKHFVFFKKVELLNYLKLDEKYLPFFKNENLILSEDFLPN